MWRLGQLHRVMVVCEDPLQWALRLARRVFGRRRVAALPWRWDAAMAVLGLTRLTELDGTAHVRYADGLCGYQDRHRDLARIKYADHCAPALCSELLLRRHACTEAEFAIDRVASFLRTCPRNPHGVLDHLGRSRWSLVYPKSVWVDSLMMYVCVAHRIAWRLGDEDLRAFALHQVVAFRELLQGPDGLFSHAFVPRCGGRVGSGWLRGNGWAALALVEMLELEGTHDALVETFARLAEALILRQRHDGLWPTMLNDEGSYAEVSGSALVATALAKASRLGLLPSSVRDRGWRALEAAARTPADVSLPTIPLPQRWYGQIPRWPGQLHGTGALLLLATELATVAQAPAHANAAAPAAAASPSDDSRTQR